MAQDYAARLNIPVAGNDLQTFFLPCGEIFARGYRRVVIGGRGPYLELLRHQILAGITPPVRHYFYQEHRTEKDNVKIYWQVRRVDYADYLPGLYYVSPFDLRLADGGSVIKPRMHQQCDLFDTTRRS